MGGWRRGVERAASTARATNGERLYRSRRPEHGPETGTEELNQKVTRSTGPLPDLNAAQPPSAMGHRLYEDERFAIAADWKPVRRAGKVSAPCSPLQEDVGELLLSSTGTLLELDPPSR